MYVTLEYINKIIKILNLTIVDSVDQKKYNRTDENVEHHDGGPNQLIRIMYSGSILKTENRKETRYERHCL